MSIVTPLALRSPAELERRHIDGQILIQHRDPFTQQTSWAIAHQRRQDPCFEHAVTIHCSDCGCGTTIPTSQILGWIPLNDRGVA
ncbi:MAG: hypothetical protein Alpg2KO_01090 [Alphaproteobacteria bacterium]